MNTNRIKTKRLRRSITASVAAFSLGTCILSSSYATAEPTSPETLNVVEMPSVPEFGEFVGLGFKLFFEQLIGNLILGPPHPMYIIGSTTPPTKATSAKGAVPNHQIAYISSAAGTGPTGMGASLLGPKSKSDRVFPEFMLDG